MKHRSFLVYITFFSLITILFSACSDKKKSMRYDVSNNISYLEASPITNYSQIMEKEADFKPLEKKDFNKLSRLISDPQNFLWLRIQFTIPPELKAEDMGLYIGQLRSADVLYLNNSFIRKYGEFPPNETTAGYVAQYFMFPQKIINKHGLNNVYIKVWPGSMGSISSNVYISNQADIYYNADRTTFFNSKIIVAFAGVMLLIFFLYIFLYFVMRKYSNSNEYLFYALLNFYTLFFLFPLFISEMSWAKPPFLSYLGMLKGFFLFGALTTVYFANSFIIAYLGYKDSNRIIIIRLVLYVVPIILIACIRQYSGIAKVMPYVLILGLSQFCFSIPRIFISYYTDKKKRKTTISMLIGFSPVIAGLAADLILKGGGLCTYLPYFTIYGWQITIYFFLGILLFKFGNMYRHNTTLKNQLSEFNSHLEEVVAIRTKELSEANYVLSKGLETVAHVQKNFLPPKNRSFRGWDLSISYNALDSDVSGDLYDYYFTDGFLDGLGIFDVSGHGIPAGLMTILAKSIISQHFINGLNQEEPISNVLRDINNSYIKEKVNVENYITGILFRFSEFNKKDICSVEFANAGHPYPLLYKASEKKVVELKQDQEKQYGILGVEGLDVSFPPINLRVSKDDIIVCYTDGLTDCINNKGQDFSKERIIRLIEEYHDESAIMLMNRIIDKFSNFIGKEKLTDDITLIVLKRVNSKDYIEEI